MKSEGTLLLSRGEIAGLLSMEQYIGAVERVFHLYGEGKTQPPGILGVHAHDGGFHIKAGIMELHAELGEVVAGIKPGRTSPDEIIIFDSTGMALQDVIAAATIFTKAVDKGAGRIVNLAQ